MTTQNRIKTVLTLAVVAMAIVSLMTAAANAAVIFVVDAPNDGNIIRRVPAEGDGTIWPGIVTNSYDLSTDGDSAAGLVGTVELTHICGWFEPTALPPHFNDDYAGDLNGAGKFGIWTATGYTSGMTVEVYVTWRSQHNFSQAAPYSINGVFAATVNMDNNSGGGEPAADLVLDDPAGGTEAFQFLGTATADGSGAVEVKVEASGGFTPIDSVALVSGPLDPNLPSVDAGDDMISWSGQAVLLDPNVVNNDTTIPQGTLAYLWTAAPDGIGDPNLDVAITGADQEDASVTITKTATGDATVVKMTLAVTLPGKDPVTDSMTIDVYDDSCLAAAAAGPVELDITDIDGNCITAFPDFAVMAATWLDDYTLTEPVVK